MRYVVKVTEKFVKHVVIEAENKYLAEEKAWDAYDREDISLDYRDYDGADVQFVRLANEDDEDYMEIN